jgi:hypothetical protein
MNKKNYQILIVISILLALPALSFGQGAHEMIVPPATGPGIYLNNAIVGDTNSNGTRVDPDRVYVLQRDGMYLVNAVITNNYVLRIKAAEGTGKKPVVFLVPNTSTGTNPPGNFANIRGSIYLTNIVLSGIFDTKDPADTTNYLAGMQGALISTNAPGLDIVVNGCILLNTNGNHIRTDQAPRLVKITDNIFGNMGYLGRSNLGAGKGMDVRGGSVDSLIVVNNTFINWQDRIIRHYNATGAIKYLKFEHNTLINGMSYHGMLSLGYVKNNISIANNLILDGFCLGNDTDFVRQVEFADSKEKDAYGNPRMVWVITAPNDTVQYNIKNNYYAISTDGQKFLTDNGLTEGSKLTWFTNKKIGADSTKTFVKTDISFTNVPKLMLAFIKWYRTPLPNGPQKSKLTGMWNSAYDYDRRLSTYFRDSLSCVYPTTNAAYTGGSDGFPAGDLNWFPSKKSQWALTGVESQDKNVKPEKYSLDQNFPNPFNPTTNISFSLPKESVVNLKIFNSVGQEITEIISGEKYAAGKYNLSWNGKDASGKYMPTGLYFYQLNTNGLSMTKKMLLLK